MAFWPKRTPIEPHIMYYCMYTYIHVNPTSTVPGQAHADAEDYTESDDEGADGYRALSVGLGGVRRYVEASSIFLTCPR